MANALPPLAAMRAFEAAARLESFSRAADEIHLTHGAVSHQVRALEAFVGVPLFVRQGRGVVLTGDGRALAAEIRGALERIGAAAQAIRRRAASNRLTISVLPSFGSRWLMPRIARFMSAHPGWDVSIDSSASLADFARDDIDVAIRFGHAPWPHLHHEWLMDDDYIMVASPRYNGGRLPSRPDQVKRHTLLRADPEPWKSWCEAAGIDLLMPTTGVAYQDMGVMLQSAIDGDGIMLSRRAIAAADIEKGALVQLFDIAIPAGLAYWIVWPDDAPPSDRVLAFRHWIVAEITAASPAAAKRRKPRAKAKKTA